MPEKDEPIQPEESDDELERKYPGITAFLKDPDKTLGEIAQYFKERGIETKFLGIHVPPLKPDPEDNGGDSRRGAGDR